jgi:hypothetical protein
MSGTREVPATEVKQGQFVRSQYPEFYGTVESMDFPVGTQKVIFHLQANYVFSIDRFKKVEVQS